MWMARALALLTLSACSSDNNLDRLQSPPTVEILSPDHGDLFRQGQGEIRFEGLVADSFDDPTELLVSWGTADGDVDAQADADGKVELLFDPTALDTGPWPTSLTATDTDGLSATAKIEWLLAGPLGAPLVTITAPPDGTEVLEGGTLTFTGEALDATTPADQLTFAWNSDLDGPLSGALSADGQSIVPNITLSLGDHIVTLEVLDQDGEIGEDSIVVHVVEDVPEDPVEEDPVDAEEGDLVFSEMLVNPEVVEDEKGEWIELYNTSGHPIDVAGYNFHDDDVDAWILDGPLVVQGHDYLVLCAEMDTAINGGVPCDGWFFRDSSGNGLALSNKTDELVLTRPDGVEIDWLQYLSDWFTPGVATGVDPAFLEGGANNDGANWCDQTTVVSTGGEPGTPGLENDPCE